MNRRFLLTFSAATWLIGAYLLYAHFVSPVVEPKQLTSKAPNPLTEFSSQAGTRASLNDEHHAAATQFLPGQDWAKDAANKLKFGDILVYTNDIEQIAANSGASGALPGGTAMRLKPFALVWTNPNSKPGELPLRITAESALIEFDAQAGSAEAALFSGSKQGRPTGGTLEGMVRIEGPNGLLVVGRGFTFSEQALRLWSDNDIMFHYGPHHGTGHGLQVDFLPAAENQIVKDQPHLGGLRSVAVLRQVVMNLVGESAPPGKQRRSPLKEGDQLNIVSDGRMQFDMEANLITFDHNVRVRHPLPSKLQEGINCDLLTLVLSEGKALRVPPVSPENPGQEIALASNEAPAAEQGMASWLPESLSLDKLLADGAGKRRVELFSQPRELHCNTGQVDYDLVKRVLHLRDQEASVDVLQAQQQIHAPDIMLVFHENNRDVQMAVARGAGNASSRMNDGRTVSAKWQKQLVKSFDPKSNNDFVELQGDAAIGLDQDYELKGDALRIWFTPMVVGDKSGTPAAGNGPRQDDAAVPRIEHVAGVGQVVLKSPQATAHTKSLDVSFKTTDLPPEVPGEDAGLFGLQNPANQAAPAASARPGARRPSPQQEAATIPLDLKADTIRAFINRDRTEPTRMALSELWADEAVTVTQPMKPGQPPMQVLGTHLDIVSKSDTQQVVTVTGSPAQIRSGVSRLEGNDIRLDRENNTLKVLGAGVLQYPVNMALDGQPLDRPQLLQVKWAERLDFNGQTASFYEKVEASLRQSVMRCNAMHVSLSSPVRFDDPQLQKLTPKQLQLAKIFCENKVELESAEYLGNTIVRLSHGKLGQFVINNITGKTEAQGPGHFMEWRRGQRQPDARTEGNGAAKSIPRADKSRDWTYSRIDFQGRMKGNVRERFTTFEDHVAIVYGPVQHATDHINPDELPEGAALPEGTAEIRCDALKVEQYAETEAAPAFVKLSAEGNTRLELEWSGHPLDVMADEVKFDESKDYYLLRSIGTQKVIVNREPTTDDPRGMIQCSRMDIWNPPDPSQRVFKVQQATVLNGIQPGG